MEKERFEIIYKQTNDEVDTLMFFGKDLKKELKEKLIRRAIYLDKGARLFSSCVHYLTQKERELAFNNAIKNKEGHLLLDGYCYEYLTEKEKKICIYNAIANGKGAYLLRYCFNKLTEEEMKLACNQPK